MVMNLDCIVSGRVMFALAVFTGHFVLNLERTPMVCFKRTREYDPIIHSSI